eukprot:m.338824 g.338824  ORF g.338824 m.338824 type:complete len:169 (-) comp20568_c0_seq3:302-808(-)
MDSIGLRPQTTRARAVDHHASAAAHHETDAGPTTAGVRPAPGHRLARDLGVNPAVAAAAVRPGDNERVVPLEGIALIVAARPVADGVVVRRRVDADHGAERHRGAGAHAAEVAAHDANGVDGDHVTPMCAREPSQQQWRGQSLFECKKRACIAHHGNRTTPAQLRLIV